MSRLTGSAKPEYWQEMLAPNRHFLVAETDKGALAGFIAGEIRAWEFGQPPAGWVFAIQIEPKLRLKGVGSQLFDALVARFKENVDKAHAAIEAVPGDADFMVPWTLKRGGKAFFTVPRAAALRTFLLNHMIHHRGQLTVYLRLQDVPLPSVYGPTADQA